MSRAAAGSAALTFCFLIFGLKARQWLMEHDLSQHTKALRCVIGTDPVPCLLTDEQGKILYQNEEAQAWFQVACGTALALALQPHFASPGAVVFRLQSQISRTGFAQEQVVSAGRYLGVSGHQITVDRYLWRIEQVTTGAGLFNSLDGVGLPILTADAEGWVHTANAAMAKLLGTVPKRLDQIFAMPNPIPGDEVKILTHQGLIQALLVEMAGPQAQREIYLFPPMADRGGDPSLAEFDAVPVPLAKFTTKGHLAAANAAARALLEVEDAAGMMFHDLFEGLGRPVAD